MIVIDVRNVHQALPEGCRLLTNHGQERPSRNGRVLVAPCPVTTLYRCPQERVLFWPERDANPFFHLLESLWMLGGRDDVAWLAAILPRMAEFSDDGARFNAAYGHRWRRHFGRDQLKEVAAALQASPDCRRQVIGIWDPRHDLGLKSKDLPCNTQVMVQLSADGHLDVMVTNRSNDAIWGAYGANAVQFSMLQEYLAARVGVPVGHYWQVSMNTHCYEAHWPMMRALASQAPEPPGSHSDPYTSGRCQGATVVNIKPDRWDRELDTFLKLGAATTYVDPFFENVAKPMLEAHLALREKQNPARFSAARAHLNRVLAPDWQLAGLEWVARREKK